MEPGSMTYKHVKFCDCYGRWHEGHVTAYVRSFGKWHSHKVARVQVEEDDGIHFFYVPIGHLWRMECKCKLGKLRKRRRDKGLSE